MDITQGYNNRPLTYFQTNYWNTHGIPHLSNEHKYKLHQHVLSFWFLYIYHDNSSSYVIIVAVTLILIKTDLMSIITLCKVNVFSRSKESYESKRQL